MVMASEEEDYMSDTFLQNIGGKEDIRPGLIRCHAQQYEHKKAVKKMKSDDVNRVCNPSLKEKEAVMREGGLSKPLDCENLGFKMLQKFGFKPGSGLGKTGEGRIEPISVEVKTDRQGLGRKSSLEEIARLRAKYKTEIKEKLLNVDDFRIRQAEQAAEKRSSLDLMKSQRVCWELDSKEGIEEPAEIWFWPESKLPKHDSDVEEDEGESNEVSTSDSYDQCEDDAEEDDTVEDEGFSVQEKLEMLTLYLRRTYLYCVWCGHTFDDEKDMQDECPGPTRDDH